MKKRFPDYRIILINTFINSYIIIYFLLKVEFVQILLTRRIIYEGGFDVEKDSCGFSNIKPFESRFCSYGSCCTTKKADLSLSWTAEEISAKEDFYISSCCTETKAGCAASGRAETETGCTETETGCTETETGCAETETCCAET